MSKDKVTMRDVAQACGVSLATVSYVLANSEKEHISHDTRIKVLEIAKGLHYVPPAAPRKTKKEKSNLVGIIINWNKRNSSSKKMIYYDLAGELQRQLVKSGYDTLLATTKDLEENADIISKRSLEATFIIDIDTSIVKQVTNKYYVPIIFLDCEINDPLFCTIYPDYDSIILRAKSLLQEDGLYLVMEDILNDELKTLITKHFEPGDVFINNRNNSLRDFLQKRSNRKGLIIGDILGIEAERYVNNSSIVVVTSLDDNTMLLPDTKVISVKNKYKAEIAVDALKDLLKMDYSHRSQNRILLSPDN